MVIMINFVFINPNHLSKTPHHHCTLFCLCYQTLFITIIYTQVNQFNFVCLFTNKSKNFYKDIMSDNKTVPSISDNNNNNCNKNILDDKAKASIEDDFDTKKEIKIEDLIRGSTPDGIVERCVKLCQTYIGGSWNKIDDLKEEEVVVVKRIPGGLTNQLYHVALVDSFRPNITDSSSLYDKDSEPREVAIKFYQSKHLKVPGNSEEPERLSDTIISTIVSQLGIGPIVYGIFDGGVVHSYHKHEQFRIKHQQNPELVAKLAYVLAQINLLDVPVSKCRDQYLEMLRSKLDDGYGQHNVPELAKQYKLEVLAKQDIRQEFEQLSTFLRQSDSPTVFTHNDFRGSNIMVTEPANRLVICDFEYSTYGPRGYDIACLLVEWDKDFGDFFNWKMPSDEIITNFVTSYVESCEQIQPGYRRNPLNSVERIVYETKIGVLPVYMLFVAFMFGQKEPLVKDFPFGVEQQMKATALYYQLYLNVKNILIKDGTITESF